MCTLPTIIILVDMLRQKYRISQLTSLSAFHSELLAARAVSHKLGTTSNGTLVEVVEEQSETATSIDTVASE